MQEAALVYLLNLDHNISVPTATRRRDNILVEGERYEDDDSQEIDGGADGAHAFGDLDLVKLAQITAAEPSLHEGWSQPANHGKAEAKGENREGEGRYKRLAIAVKGIGNDSGGGRREGKERERLGAGERGRGGGGAVSCDGHGGGDDRSRSGQSGRECRRGRRVDVHGSSCGRIVERRGRGTGDARHDSRMRRDN